MCTDHSLQSKEFQEIQLNGRYGNFDDESLAKLRTLTASENDLKDPEWNKKTTLTGYHYFSQNQPERTNADSINASALVKYMKDTGNGILCFEAIHSPPSKVKQLAAMPNKEFQNLPSKLYLCKGCKVILTSNINPSFSLFNSAPAIYRGPLYLSECWKAP